MTNKQNGLRALAFSMVIGAVVGGVTAQDGECMEPELVGSLGTATYHNSSWDAVREGNLVYLAGSRTGLQVVDVSDPALPVVVQTLDPIGIEDRIQGIDVENSYLYIAERVTGLRIIDLTDPASQTVYQTPWSAWDVEVVGTTAYVVYGRSSSDASGLEILDVSDPSSPILLGSFVTAGFSTGVTISGTRAYISDNSNGLVILDVSDPSSPTLLGTFATAGAVWDDAFVVDQTAFVVTQSNRTLQIIDVQDPAAPILLGSIENVGSNDVAVFGDRAVTTGMLSASIIDVSDYANPTRLVSFPNSFPLAQMDSSQSVMLMRGNGFRAYDISGELGGNCFSDCRVDMNRDGILNFFDVSAFVTAFIAGDPFADMTGTGTLDFHDISIFLGMYQAGCP